MNKKILSVAIFAALFTSACSLAPDYDKPSIPVSATWDESNAVETPVLWEEQFTDPHLQELIRIGLSNNRDMRIAILNVAEYEAQYRISRSKLIPTVGLDASYSRGTNTSRSITNPETTVDTYKIGLGLSWEIDLFGKVRNTKNMVLEQYFAQYENQRAVQISLVAAIANAYYTYIADKELLALSNETLITEQDSYKLTKNKYDIGSASELELSQAQTAVASAEINVANYERVLKLDYNQLLLLVGTTLPKFDALSKITDISIKPISLLTKESIIENRPDILASEHMLKAANFNIGVARASLLPSISFSGVLGLASDSFGNLFNSDHKLWSLGPSISMPIFNMALYANLDVVDIQKQKAIANYEKTIQSAFKEVSDAADSFEKLNKQYVSQQKLYEATEKYFDMADLRYNQGVDSYLTRLDAQRQFVAARQGLVSTKLALLSTHINLFKAIGGSAPITK